MPLDKPTGLEPVLERVLEEARRAGVTDMTAVEIGFWRGVQCGLDEAAKVVNEVLPRNRH